MLDKKVNVRYAHICMLFKFCICHLKSDPFYHLYIVKRENPHWLAVLDGKKSSLPTIPIPKNIRINEFPES